MSVSISDKERAELMAYLELKTECKLDYMALDLMWSLLHETGNAESVASNMGNRGLYDYLLSTKFLR